jgi:hypothetical protein
MSFKLIEWAAGASIDGSVGQPGIYTATLDNVFLDDQKQPVVRAANEFMVTYGGTPSTFIRGYQSLKRKWIVIATRIDDLNVTIAVFSYASTPVVYSKTLTSTSIINSVFFEEFDAECFTAVNSSSAKINTVSGLTAVLITGLNTVYYLDDGFAVATPVAKEFKIKTVVYPNGVSIRNPVDCTPCEARLLIICDGPRLVTTTTVPEYIKNRVILSQTYNIDNFVVVSTDEADFKINPIDFYNITNSNEEFYSVTTNENLIIIVTNLGLRIMRTSDDSNPKLTSDNMFTYIGGFGDTIRARAFPFAGFLVFATKYTLRAKMLQSLETDYVNTIDLVLPLLSEFSNSIRDISMDYNTQNLMVYLNDGVISNISPQSIIPSKSYNLTLPITNSYKTECLSYLYATGLNPMLMLVQNQNENGDYFYSLLKYDVLQNQYGLLLDGAQQYYWSVTATNVSTNSFTATFSEAMLNTSNISGLWLLDGTKWRFYATDGINYPKFITTTVGHTIVNNTKYSCILVVLENAYQTFPGCFAQVCAVAELNISMVGDTDGIEYNYFEFHNAPVDCVCNFNGIPTDQTYTGDMVYHMAMNAPTMAIGWRDINCVDNLYNRGGIRCVLLSNSSDISKYVDFYNENGSVCVQYGTDSTEIEFQTNVGASYEQKYILARAKKFLSLSRNKKFTYLIGQY